MFIFLLLSFTLLHAQKLIDLYKEYFPRVIFENENNIKAENSKLEIYAELNPDLIFYYLNRLNFKLDKDNIFADSTQAEKFTTVLKASQYLKNDWAEKNIRYISENYDAPLKQNLLSFFKKYLKSDIPENDFKKLDTLPHNNKLDYVRYIYFSKDKNTIYDEKVDYSQKMEEALERLIAYFEYNYTKLKNTQATNNDLLFNAAKYSYLFKDSYLPNYSNTTQFRLVDLLTEFFKKELEEGNELLVGLSYDLFPMEMSVTGKVKGEFDEIYNYGFSLGYKPIMINFGYNYKVKRINQAFPSVNIHIGLSLFNLYLSPKNLYSDYFIRGGNGYMINGTYRFDTLINKNTITGILQASLPLLFVHNFRLEGGVYSGLVYASYTYQLAFYGSAHSSNGMEIPSFYTEPKEYKSEKIDLYLYPVLILNYNFLNRYNLVLKYYIEGLQIGFLYSI